MPQKAALKDSKGRWCQDGIKVVPREERMHGECQHSPRCQTSSAGACVLTRTLPPPVASFVQIPKGHKKPNNSKDLFVISDPQASEQILILSILQMRKLGTFLLTQQPRAEPENPDFLGPHLILYSVNSCKQPGFPLPFSLQDVFTFPQ